MVRHLATRLVLELLPDDADRASPLNRASYDHSRNRCGSSVQCRTRLHTGALKVLTVCLPIQERLEPEGGTEVQCRLMPSPKATRW